MYDEILREYEKKICNDFLLPYAHLSYELFKDSDFISLYIRDCNITDELSLYSGLGDFNNLATSICKKFNISDDYFSRVVNSLYAAKIQGIMVISEEDNLIHNLDIVNLNSLGDTLREANINHKDIESLLYKIKEYILKALYNAVIQVYKEIHKKKG